MFAATSEQHCYGETRLNELRRRAVITAGLVAILAGFFTFAVRTMNPNELNRYGSTQSQTIVMVASRNFAESGFSTLKFTPLIPLTNAVGGSADEIFYTHNPPLPYYIGGIVWKIGGQSLVYYRLLNILVGGLFLLGAYMFFTQLFNPVLGLLTVAVLASQSTLYVINLNAPEALADMLAVWSLAFLLAALKHRSTKTRFFWAGSWILYFLSSYASFELIVATQVIASAIIWFTTQKNRLPRIFAMGMAPIAAQILHFANNAWALGGFDEAFQDLADTFLWRTLDIGRGTSYLQEIAGGVQGYPGWLAERVAEDYYGPQALLIVLALAVSFSFVALRSRNHSEYVRYAGIVLLMTAAGVSWWLMFPQQTAIHFNSLEGRHWLLVHSLLLGGGIYLLLNEVWHNLRQRKMQVGLALIPLLLLSLVFVNNVQQTIGFEETADRLTWRREHEVLKRVSQVIPDNGLLLTSQQLIASAAFLHQPREMFEIGAFDVALVTTPEELGNNIELRCRYDRCYLLEEQGSGDQTGVSLATSGTDLVDASDSARVQVIDNYVLQELAKPLGD